MRSAEHVPFKTVLERKFLWILVLTIALFTTLYTVVAALLVSWSAESMVGSFVSVSERYLLSLLRGSQRELGNVRTKIDEFIEEIRLENPDPTTAFEKLQAFVSQMGKLFPGYWHVGSIYPDTLPSYIRDEMKEPVSRVLRVSVGTTKRLRAYIRFGDSYFLVEHRDDVEDAQFLRLVETLEKIGNVRKLVITNFDHEESFWYPENLSEDEKRRISKTLKSLQGKQQSIVSGFLGTTSVVFTVSQDSEDFPSTTGFYIEFFMTKQMRIVSSGVLIISVIAASLLLGLRVAVSSTSARVSVPLQTLASLIKEFSQDKQLRPDAHLHSDISEFKTLFEVYASMAREITGYIDRLESMNRELEDAYRSLELMSNEVRSSYLYFSRQLAVVAESYDESTGNHIERVGELSAFLASKLGLDERFVEQIRIYAPLHDVGKILVPREILEKPGKLSDEEFEIMKLHTLHGARLIGNSEYLTVARHIALYHHERYDGTGYPFGLRGDEIPLEAQIVAIVDVYDALRSKRPYKEPMSHESALKILTMGDGRTTPKGFNPKVLEVFVRHEREVGELWEAVSERTKV